MLFRPTHKSRYRVHNSAVNWNGRMGRDKAGSGGGGGGSSMKNAVFRSSHHTPKSSTTPPPSPNPQPQSVECTRGGWIAVEVRRLITHWMKRCGGTNRRDRLRKVAARTPRIITYSVAEERNIFLGLVLSTGHHAAPVEIYIYNT